MTSAISVDLNRVFVKRESGQERTLVLITSVRKASNDVEYVTFVPIRMVEGKIPRKAYDGPPPGWCTALGPSQMTLTAFDAQYMPLDESDIEARYAPTSYSQ